MTEWCQTKLDDESKFEFACPPDRQEFELVGERQADGKWQCTLTRYTGGTANVSMHGRGNRITSFTANSPEHAKQLAEQQLPQLENYA